MVIGWAIIRLRLYGPLSLKDKRKIVKSIINRVRNNYNVSIAEVGLNDVVQSAEIGFASVGNSKAVVNSKIDKILNFIDNLGLAEMIDSQIEIMTV